MKNRLFFVVLAIFTAVLLSTGCQKQKSCESAFYNDGRLLSGFLQKLDEPYKTDDTFVLEGYKITAHFTDVDGNVFYLAGNIPKGIKPDTPVSVILAEVEKFDNLYHTKKMIYTLSCISEDK